MLVCYEVRCITVLVCFEARCLTVLVCYKVCCITVLLTRVSDDTAMTPLGSAAASNSVDAFESHPPPVRQSGPREPPSVRAWNLGERLSAGISVLNQSHPIGLDPLSSGSNPGNPLRDQAPCLLSNTIQDDQRPAAEEDGEPLLSCPGAVPADVGAAALRTTEARRVLDDSFSSLCAAIEAYNEAVRCEAHLRGVYGLLFSPWVTLRCGSKVYPLWPSVRLIDFPG